MTRIHFALLLASAAAAATAPAGAQVTPADSAARARQDSLTLGALQDAAIERDPRGRELALLIEQSRLRQQNIAAERLPTLRVEGQAIARPRCSAAAGGIAR